MKLRSVSLGGFGGGINDYQPSDKIASNEWLNTSRNVRTDAGMVKPRKGYATFADTLTGGYPITSLGIYTRNIPANDKLIAIQNNKIWSNSGSDPTWTEISQSFLTTGTNVEILAYRDWCFLFNSVDKPLRIDGTTVTQDLVAPSSVSTANFLPGFGAIYNQQMWVSGVPSAPNTVFISKVSSSATPQNVYDFSGSLRQDQGANEILLDCRVVGIKALSTAIVIFTVKGAWYVPGYKTVGSRADGTPIIQPDLQPIGGSSGAVSQKAITVVENDIYYLTPQKEIKSIRRGFSDQLSMIVKPFSVKIQRFLTATMNADLTTACSYYDETNKYYNLCFKEVGKPTNAYRIVGDVHEVSPQNPEQTPSWGIDDNTPFSCGISWKGQSFVGSAFFGQVYIDQLGTADDNNANIYTVLDTGEWTANNPQAYKNFRGADIYINVTIATRIRARIKVDGHVVEEKYITSADIPGTINSIASGIGTAPVGTNPIGVEVENTEITGSTLIPIVKRLDCRKKGKRIAIELITDGINNDYQLMDIAYNFCAVSPLVFPVSEK